MAARKTVEDLFIHELSDVYSAEMGNCTPLDHPFAFDLTSRLHRT